MYLSFNNAVVAIQYLFTKRNDINYFLNQRFNAIIFTLKLIYNKK